MVAKGERVLVKRSTIRAAKCALAVGNIIECEEILDAILDEDRKKAVQACRERAYELYREGKYSYDEYTSLLIVLNECTL